MSVDVDVAEATPGATERQDAIAGLSVELHKSYERIPTADGAELCAVRKRPVSDARGAILFVHGLGQNRYTFHLEHHSLTTWLVAHGYDTWNLELRGHGRSRETSPRPRSADDYIQLDFPAAAKAVAERTRLPVFAMGHSIGGGVCYAGSTYAVEHLAGLVGLSPVYRFGGRQPMFRVIGKALAKLPRTKRIDLRPLPVELTGRVLTGSLGVIESRAMSYSPFTLWEPKTLPRKQLRERIRRGFDQLTIGVLRHLMDWARTREFTSYDGDIDYAARWRTLGNVPLLVLGADRDTLLPPSDAKIGYAQSPSRDKTFRVFGKQDGGRSWGHVDLVQGRRAPTHVWPIIRRWLDDRTKP